MTTDARLLNAAAPPGLRPFDVSRDLNPVADLIELCFAETLGDDGHRYLRQMRTAARNPRFLRWALTVSDYVSLPLSGFVWEENGQVVGNLSLIPFNSSKERVYLIANVAVHPHYRRMGIARTLTESALDLATRRKRFDTVWLHVRSDNPPAIQLYQSMGFQERGRRTSWRKGPDFWPEEAVPGVRLVSRRASHWRAQRRWLRELYPQELQWNMAINVSRMRPGLGGLLYRLLTGTQLHQWSAVQDNKLLGVLSWQRSGGPFDHLWLAAPPEGEPLAAKALLGPLNRLVTARRTLALEFPAGCAEPELQAAGFTVDQTLIWMRQSLK